MMEVTVKFRAELLDPEDEEFVPDMVRNGVPVFTVCEVGGDRFVVPRVCRANVLGYIVVPTNLDVESA